MNQTARTEATDKRRNNPAWVARTDSAARSTLRRMRESVRRAVADVDFQLWARNVIQRTGANLRDPHGIAHAVRDFVASHLTFVRDPYGLESIAPPHAHMAALRQYGRIAGDCDDAATLAAALGQALGLRAAFTVEAFDWGRGPSPYQHVYTTLLSPHPSRPWAVKVDTTRDAQALPPKVQRRLSVLV